ncbi:MAG: N-acetylneuraminate synthase [Labilithrix sp.]|nr:N-acetylneuraminate synthase [Labilithrix sp.]
MSQVLIIAEAGVNHNGSVGRALELVDVAADAGADAVKFQTFRADELASKTAHTARYQASRTGEAEQLAMLQSLELDEAAHARISERCAKRGIEFMSTAFDPASVLLLERLGVRRFKIPSGEITNPLLLRAIRACDKPMILSTGMCNLADIEWALAVLAHPNEKKPRYSPTTCSTLNTRVTLLHCTTEYPAPMEDVNLRAMCTMRAAFELPVGYSDHTLGLSVPTAAVALGATVIEKHFTLDRSLAGPDHQASLEPRELEAMVRAIRDVTRALGSGIKAPTASEFPNVAVARRSIVACRSIRSGERFSAENVTVKRPGSGISAARWDDVIGDTAKRDYEADELID